MMNYESGIMNYGRKFPDCSGEVLVGSVVGEMFNGLSAEYFKGNGFEAGLFYPALSRDI